MSNDVFFVVETQLTDENGRKLSRLLPDEDGWYRGVPVAVLSDKVITRNNTRYNPKSLQKAMEDPNSTFNIRLKNGDLFGEYDHPFLPSNNVNDPKTLLRLFKLDPERKSVHYRKVYVENDDEVGTPLIYSELKPMGPYGKYAKELLDDPYVNFSSSLRALSRQKKLSNGVLDRQVVKLITFDVAVPGSGYEYSTKRYAKVSYENICDMLSHEGLLEISDDGQKISVESIFTNTELNEIFSRSTIRYGAKIVAYKIDRERLMVDQKDRSLYGIVGDLI